MARGRTIGVNISFLRHTVQAFDPTEIIPTVCGSCYIFMHDVVIARGGSRAAKK